MTFSGTPPHEPRGVKFDRAVDAIENGNQRWQRLRSAFPGFVKIFLILGLAALSWLATYSGMLELIAANTGPIDLQYMIYEADGNHRGKIIASGELKSGEFA